MTKSELSQKVAEMTSASKKDAEASVNAVFVALTEALAAKEKVQIAGFGGFEVRERPARTCINPRTKEKVDVAATSVPAFKAGKSLKEAVAK